MRPSAWAYTEPHDPSLLRAQCLIDAMFLEYGDAVAHLAKGKPDAGKRMFRAYGLANFAREILVEAQPELAKRGSRRTPPLDHLADRERSRPYSRMGAWIRGRSGLASRSMSAGTS